MNLCDYIKSFIINNDKNTKAELLDFLIEFGYGKKLSKMIIKEISKLGIQASNVDNASFKIAGAISILEPSDPIKSNKWIFRCNITL